MFVIIHISIISLVVIVGVAVFALRVIPAARCEVSSWKGRNVNLEGLGEAHWGVNPLSSLPRGLCLIASSKDEAPDARRGAAPLTTIPTAGSMRVTLRGIPGEESTHFRTSGGGWLTHEGLHRALLLMWSRFPVELIICPAARRGGTWVNFMARLSYHLAQSALRSCGNPVPARSGRHLEWTPQSKCRGQRICWKNLLWFESLTRPPIHTFTWWLHVVSKLWGKWLWEYFFSIWTQWWSSCSGYKVKLSASLHVGNMRSTHRFIFSVWTQ